MKAVNDNLDKIRKQIRFKVKIRGAKWLILKNRDDLGDEKIEELNLVLRQSKCLQRAYELKERFREIYENTPDREIAKNKF